MSDHKTVAITDFLTAKQIKAAAACQSAAEIDEKVIGPNMVEIDRRLGQKNDSRYLAFLIEYVFRETGVWR